MGRSRVEEHLGGPTATPHEIVPVILGTMYDDGEERDVKTVMPLSKKLWEVAQHHGDQIPLHGRLFQQWLHYVKPQECPYPHKRGSVEAVNLASCGKDCVIVAKAAAKDMVHDRLEGPLSQEDSEDGAWMSQGLLRRRNLSLQKLRQIHSTLKWAIALRHLQELCCFQ